MFAFFKNRRRQLLIKKALKSLTSETGEYSFEPETIRIAFEAVAVSLSPEQRGIELSDLEISHYHSPYFLLSELEEVNRSLADQCEINNYNHHAELKKTHFRFWFVDSDSQRCDYYAFTKAMSALVKTHIDLLSDAKDKLNKTRYRACLGLLYTIHCDCLMIAELHLRKYG